MVLPLCCAAVMMLRQYGDFFVNTPLSFEINVYDTATCKNL